jgi:heme exporter protein A
VEQTATPPAQAPPVEGAAIELDGLQRDYGERTVLEDVSLRVQHGRTLVVLGPNGSGKTTLMRVLAGLLRPSGGRVEVLGCTLPGEAWKLSGRIGWVGHEPLLYRDLTARENLRFAGRLYGIDSEAAEDRIGSLLDRVGLGRRADDRIRDYSAGMTQRVAVCRAALHEPELFLLDEPFSHLDAGGRQAVEPLLGGFSGKTRVVVTHEIDAAAGADQVLRLPA